MQVRPTHPSSQLVALDLAVKAIEVLRNPVAKIRRHDRDLGEQLRRALSSVALNLAEGSGNYDGNKLTRYSTAQGSNYEARNALRVAIAWGYVSTEELADGEALLDRVSAMLYRLRGTR